MQPAQILALIRLHQWAHDRAQLSAGHTSDYRRIGYRQRRQREADSRLVRVLDFERALAMLPAAEQAALLLVFREQASRRSVAFTIGCCERTAVTLVHAALAHLAATLDRLGLL
jgi:DNA-directed RNA polymerase specialized sigma24 family protein